MTMRRILVGATLAALTPAMAHSQGVEIDHKAVGCIVVGKFPKMNACFAPVARLARSRVYFRPEGTSRWYYVDMKSDQPCFTGILPKPGKKLVGKKVEYYVEAQDKTFNPARTAEFQPIVVRSAQECKKDIPVAPFVNNATVAVFPSVPAGFAAGGAVGTAAVVGVVGAGAAVAGTAAVIASNDETTTTTTIATGGNPTTTTATTTTTTSTSTSTTTTLKATNHPPNAVLKTSPDPPQGFGPLTVTFDMCGSTDPDGDPLSFFFNFGDGAQASGACSQTHTYAASFRASGNVRAMDTTYLFEGSAVDPSGASQSRTRTVVAQTAPASPSPSPACAAPPPPTITDPPAGSCDTVTGIDVSVMASDPQGISNVTVKAVYNGDTTGGGICTPAGPVTEDSQTATGSAPNFSTTVNLSPPISFAKCYDLGAIVTNKCGMQSSSKINFFLGKNGCYPYAYAHDVRGTVAWSSELTVDGGRLQVIVNGSTVTYPERGHAYGMAALADGVNRVEATLVEGRGKAGLWHFDFMGTQSVAAGSIRVVAGEAVSVAADSVSFRLRGTPGERVAFTFEKK
jgi:hypothetical protein